MGKRNSFLWPFSSFSWAGCSTCLRNTDNSVSDWTCLTPPTFPRQYSLAGHTRLIIKVTFAISLQGPQGFLATLFSMDEVSAAALGSIQRQWHRNMKKVFKYMAGSCKGEGSNPHFHPMMGRIRSTQRNMEEGTDWRAENTCYEINRWGMTYLPALKAGSFQPYNLPYKHVSYHLWFCSVVTVWAEISQPGKSPWTWGLVKLSAQAVTKFQLLPLFLVPIADLDWKD